MYLKLQPNLEAVFVCDGPTHADPVTFDFVEQKGKDGHLSSDDIQIALTVVAQNHGWRIGIEDASGKVVDRCKRCSVEMAKEALGRAQEKLSRLDLDDESNQPIIAEIKGEMALLEEYLNKFDEDRKKPKKDDRQTEMNLDSQAAATEEEQADAPSEEGAEAPGDVEPEAESLDDLDDTADIEGELAGLDI